MSIHWMSSVWKVEGLSMGEKCVLLKLADNANDEGRAWPSLSRIARECCCTRQTAINNIRKLLDHGLIELDGKPGRVNRYRLQPVKNLDRQKNRRQPVKKLDGTRLKNRHEPSVTVNEPSVPPTPKGELGLRIRLCSLFGHRDSRLKDDKMNRSWSKAWATGEVTEESVAAVEWWYGFRKQSDAAKPKRYWCRTSLMTLLNNWVDDVAFIRIQMQPEMDNRKAWEKGEMIELSN